ncbi:attacin c-terminal region [Holotrichia oblita]|uniref:Attacin c-terminal region n=1 Tax=Holotrichia oblita TaxID=644536 RepID=A0ACB9T8F9_HOLOL|nr:attacin c-terminal region [Holotrichia oblita]
MYIQLFSIYVCISSVFAGVVHLPADDNEEYVLVPVSRVRRIFFITHDTNTFFNRQTIGGVDNSGRAFISHTGTLVDNDRHLLLGSASAAKQFRPDGPLTVGGSLDYAHLPSGSTLGVRASNTKGFGTDVAATGRYNFYNKGGTSVYAEGSYGRHYGGPGGTGRPDAYGGVGISHSW